MNYKKSYILMWIATVAGVLVLSVALMLNLDRAWLGVGLLIVAAGHFQTVLFCRCPRCGLRLNGHDPLLRPRYCPFCGESLWW